MFGTLSKHPLLPCRPTPFLNPSCAMLGGQVYGRSIFCPSPCRTSPHSRPSPPPPPFPPPPPRTTFLSSQEKFRIQSLRTASLKADGLSPAKPWNRHATNTSEVRLFSVTPSTLNPTCQLHAMMYLCAHRPASRGG